MTASAMRAPAVADDGRRVGAVAPQLSTDYLNRHSEALMLLEIAATDLGVVDDLRSWRPVGYREHFMASQLRCAAAALAAYDGLTPARRKSFEELCCAMNRLVSTVTALLAELPEGDDPAVIVEVASGSLRTLLGRATRFINANGALDIETLEPGVTQAEIDALFD